MSRLWLYRTTENDEDGDPLDHGVARAARVEMAVKQVRKRLVKLGHDGAAFKIYPLKDRLTTGVLEDWGPPESVSFHK